jgi:hypothetical protein
MKTTFDVESRYVQSCYGLAADTPAPSKYLIHSTTGEKFGPVTPREGCNIIEQEPAWVFEQ